MRILNVAVWAVMLSVVVTAQQSVYSPPRLLRGELPSAAPPNTVGGGEVLIEATADRSGALTHPIVLRSSPPFSNIVLDAISRWQFSPARLVTDEKESTVDGPVLIAAIYRPPMLINGPALGEPPRDLAVATNAPYPVTTVLPVYPPRARSGSVLLYEVSLDANGRVADIRGISTDPGFDMAARQALMQWQFHGGSIKGQPVPSTAYVIFGFREPIISPAP